MTGMSWETIPGNLPKTPGTNKGDYQGHRVYNQLQFHVLAITKIKTAIPPTITHRKIYRHVNLTKHVQDLDAENDKFLMKEI